VLASPSAHADPVQPHLEQLPVEAGGVLVYRPRLGQLVEASEPGLGDLSARGRLGPLPLLALRQPRTRTSGASVRSWPISVTTTTTPARKISAGRCPNGRPASIVGR
jgi:hypothetical protein